MRGRKSASGRIAEKGRPAKGTEANAAMPADAIARLAILIRMREGTGPYFAELLGDSDDVCAVFAACALLDNGDFTPQILDRILELSRYMAVRERAFRLLLDCYEYDQLERLLKVPVAFEANPRFALMEARYHSDLADLAEAERSQFLDTADVSHFIRSTEAFDRHGDWNRTLHSLVSLILINPGDARWAMRLCSKLAHSRSMSLLSQLHSAFLSAGVFPVVRRMAQAYLLRGEGRAREALGLLTAIDSSKLSAGMALEIETLCVEIRQQLG